MLEPEISRPGLWINKSWQPGTPGTFAVIIGVSKYDHLGGGSTPAPDTYDLGQLYVSALTAYQFFQWLNESYQYDGSPLAKCWLLLSPNQSESDVEPALMQHLLLPTFENCATAIGEFFNEMQALPLPSAQKSRSFFFFSGHGLEITQEKQILLPCDYLKPPVPLFNRALSTQNFFTGLAVLKVPEQFFFLDACRNDHQRLREQQIEGMLVLNAPPAYSANPGRNAPLLYASASGTQAWQPNTPAEGPSLFGRALLEGLEAQTNMEIDRSVHPFSVQIAPLQKYTRKRVMQLIEERGARVSQSVMLGGVNSDLYATVTQITSQRDVTQSVDIKTITPTPPALPTSSSFMYSSSKELHGWHPLRQGMRFNFDNEVLDIHDVFGSEQVTDIWQSVRVYSFKRRSWLPSGEDYAVRQIRRADTKAYQVEFVLLHNEGSHWLELSDGEMTFACLLPGDTPHSAPLYSLEIELSGDRIIRLSANLSPDNEAFLGEMARLWEKYRDISVVEAVENMDMGRAKEALFGKHQSPLAATVAGIILLRAHRLDLLRDWLRNLTNFFPDRPDAPVLWVEQLLQQPSNQNSSADVVSYLLKLSDRGLPQTAEAFGYAVRQVEAVLQSEGLDISQTRELESLQQKLRQALPFFRTGGLFSTFVGARGKISPSLVM